MSEPNYKSMRGHITIYLGPMFGGKTTNLLENLKKTRQRRKTTLLIKSSRKATSEYDNTVISHNLELDPQNAKVVTKLSEITDEDLKNVTTVGIDEGQFFEDLREFALRCQAKSINVAIAMLSSTFERKPFDNLAEIISCATSTTFCFAECGVCGEAASYSKRISGGNEIIEVNSEYDARCKDCFEK